MQTWFTADLHFGHTNIISYCNRPYANVAEMNNALDDNWNQHVDPKDIVFVLGDVALGNLQRSLEYVHRLRGRKLLIPGNHDACWQGHRKVSPANIAMYERVGFEIFDSQVSWNDMLLCHFPEAGDSREFDRFATYRPKLGTHKVIVHGHVHEKWKVN